MHSNLIEVDGHRNPTSNYLGVPMLRQVISGYPSLDSNLKPNALAKKMHSARSMTASLKNWPQMFHYQINTEFSGRV